MTVAVIDTVPVDLPAPSPVARRRPVPLTAVPAHGPYGPYGPDLLRRLPMPCSEPPYDDERDGARAVDDDLQGTLALRFDVALALPGDHGDDGGNGDDGDLHRRRPPSARLRLVPSADGHDPVRGPAGGDALPDPTSWAGRFVQALVEVLAGERPLAQLVRWTDSAVYSSVQRRLALAAAAAPPAVALTGARGSRHRSRVRSVRVDEPAAGIAEVGAVVQRGPRATAVALRLESRNGRWRCTALELG